MRGIVSYVACLGIKYFPTLAHKRQNFRKEKKVTEHKMCVLIVSTSFVWIISQSKKKCASGHYMYHQFNIQQFYVLPTQCIYVFCVDLRTNNDYFTIQQ